MHHDTEHQDAGRLRERLRAEGWSADLAWAMVGSGSAAWEDGASRRTIAYLSSLHREDGGARRRWHDGDVGVPPVADAREVMVAMPDSGEWMSETLEAPPALVDGDDAAAEAAPALV